MRQNFKDRVQQYDCSLVANLLKPTELKRWVTVIPRVRVQSKFLNAKVTKPYYIEEFVTGARSAQNSVAVTI